ncbi:MAG: DUF2459 domain-containing protein [Caulobacteraceae bacterium]|nr:DUF2459 domain-containing protein [Caulobacteraceae bacterium]
MRRGGQGLLVALLGALLLTFGVSRPADPALWPPQGPDRVTVYLVDNGYHSNVVLPRSALAASGGAAARALAHVPPGDWVAVGWGDRRFFTESGLSLRRALDGLRALFAPGNPSVTMFEPLPDSPERLWRSGVLRLEVSRPGFAALVRRIDASLRLRGGAPVEGPRGPAPKARFFESGEHFSIFKLCNHWAAGLLNAAGLPVRPVLDTWGSGLAFDLRSGALRRSDRQTENPMR